MSSEMENSSSTAKRKLSCTACFDALWFCYSPVHQMQQYYRLGTLDNCSGKWKAMVDCLMLKTKPRSQVEVGSYFLINGKSSKLVRKQNHTSGISEHDMKLHKTGKDYMVI
ncbi:uncharacterized protein LOC123918148 isoform X1 [Trifolium pratense]|uniref:Uncharacterized protein n=1 Tax=Trifolium pratense TaxID=57577 RepID=A0ACB0M918_TRIPR|nr:uncharacterized protein LOC123918148 isoform X1 [Trifolium pratense]CAJ2678349.1 unnamed protein product [Trifolium pratense]